MVEEAVAVVPWLRTLPLWCSPKHLKERVVPVMLVSTFLGQEVKDRLVIGQPET